MDSILTCVSEKNKVWVSTLEPRDIAHILDSLALVPSIISSFPNAAFIVDEQTKYSDKPALKGIEGEDEFEQMCENMLSQQFTINNTAKKSKAGDFFIEWKSPETSRVYKYLIDIKNYKSTVPSKEIDKFYRDLELQGSLDGAILISLHSKIVGRKSVFQYEERFVNSNMLPIAYICSNEPNVISEIIKFMCNLSEIRKICNVRMSSSEKIMMCIKDLESSIDLFSRSRGNLQDIKLMLEKQFNKIFIDLLSVEHVFKSKIDTITKTLIEEQLRAPQHNTMFKSLVSSRPQNIQQEPIEDIKPNHQKINSNEKERKDIVVSLIKSCENYNSDEEVNNMLRHIWAEGDWDLGKIDGNEWTLVRNQDETTAVFKFTKKSVTFSIPKINPIFNTFIIEKNVGRITKKGYSAKLCPDTYEIICLLCKIPI
jgi:hypothetical protein